MPEMRSAAGLSARSAGCVATAAARICSVDLKRGVYLCAALQPILRECFLVSYITLGHKNPT